MRLKPVLIGLWLCCILTSPLRGQEKRTTKEINILSAKAMEAAQGGRMEEAVSIWMDILDEVPPETQLNIHFNLALAYRKLGQLPQAWHHVTNYVHKTGRKDAKGAKLLQKIEERLTSRGFVKSAIVCIPEGAQVLLGVQDETQRVYSCPLTWWFMPGRHPVGARMAGYELTTAQLEILAHGGAGVHTLKLEKKAETETGLLVVEGTGRAVQVFINGMLEGSVPFRRKMKPGDYDLMVGKPGKMPWQKRVTIEAGKTVTEKPDVAQAVVVKPPQKIPPATGPTTITAAPEEKRRFKWEPWSLVATGGALIIGGTVMQLVAWSRNEDLLSSYPMEPETYAKFLENKAAYEGAFENDVKPLRTTSFILYGVGGAAALAGGIWLLVDRPKDRGRSRGLTLAPMAVPGGAGALVNFDF